MRKRILSILLTLCMVVGLVSTAVFAEDNMAASATATKEITKAATVTEKLSEDPKSPAISCYGLPCCSSAEVLL